LGGYIDYRKQRLLNRGEKLWKMGPNYPQAPSKNKQFRLAIKKKKRNSRDSTKGQNTNWGEGKKKRISERLWNKRGGEKERVGG